MNEIVKLSGKETVLIVLVNWQICFVRKVLVPMVQVSHMASSIQYNTATHYETEMISRVKSIAICVRYVICNFASHLCAVCIIAKSYHYIYWHWHCLMYSVAYNAPDNIKVVLLRWVQTSFGNKISILLTLGPESWHVWAWYNSPYFCTRPG